MSLKGKFRITMTSKNTSAAVSESWSLRKGGLFTQSGVTTDTYDDEEWQTSYISYADCSPNHWDKSNLVWWLLLLNNNINSSLISDKRYSEEKLIQRKNWQLLHKKKQQTMLESALGSVSQGNKSILKLFLVNLLVPGPCQHS